MLAQARVDVAKTRLARQNTAFNGTELTTRIAAWFVHVSSELAGFAETKRVQAFDVCHGV